MRDKRSDSRVIDRTCTQRSGTRTRSDPGFPSVRSCRSTRTGLRPEYEHEYEGVMHNDITVPYITVPCIIAP